MTAALHSPPGRCRDVFPLPLHEVPDRKELGELSRAVRRRVERSSHWKSWANDGIRALHELTGVPDEVAAAASAAGCANAVQASAFAHISTMYETFPPPPEGQITGQGALRELLSYDSGGYLSDLTKIRSYSRADVAWPEAGAVPSPLADGLAGDDRRWLLEWRSRMLRPLDEAYQLQRDIGLSRPYVDAVLVHNMKEYTGFVARLAEAGMLRYRRAKGKRATCGIFFVLETSGKLRIIVDTRIANCFFRSPPSTRLPTGGAWAQLETRPGDDVFIASGDIDCAFYRLQMPEGLDEYFSLPAVAGHAVGISSLDGVPLAPGETVFPCITVLPMGFSWALHLCQAYLRNAIDCAGIPVQNVLEDGHAGPWLDEPDDVAAAGCVDNYATVSHSAVAADASCDAISAGLTAASVKAHSLTRAARACVFTGMDIDGHTHRLRVRASRLWILRYALLHLIAEPFLSPAGLSIIVGHITWVLLARREALSMLPACYAFMLGRDPQRRRLWAGVVRELKWVASLIPSFATDVSLPWHPALVATDASTFGGGVCERTVDTNTVASVGRHSERWRYKVTSAYAARRRALGKDSDDEDTTDPGSAVESSEDDDGGPDWINFTKFVKVHPPRVHGGP